LRYLMEEGVNTGVRFAITNQNYDELPKVLEITRREKIPRFSLFQLVYGGRGKEIIDWDIFNEQRREVMDYIIEEARVSNGMNIVTADNYAALLRWKDSLLCRAAVRQGTGLQTWTIRGMCTCAPTGRAGQ
ncbi:MAG: hypothetical protein QF816_05155, partial [Candidatus Scalindua sp.]|nr:hypothetical protein [Candidatus Scalindua sp.]